MSTRMQRKSSAFFPPLVSEMDQMQNRLARLFAEPFAPLAPLTPFNEFVSTPFAVFPVTEISETIDAFTLTAEVPGLTRDDVTVEFENGVLTIAGKKEQERKEGNGDKQFHLYERSYGTFQRSFTFPGTIEPKGINAEFAHGVLTVYLPKTEAAKAKIRKIEILEKK